MDKLTFKEMHEIVLTALKSMVVDVSKGFIRFMLVLGLPLLGLFITVALFGSLGISAGMISAIFYISNWVYLAHKISALVTEKKKQNFFRRS